MNPLSKQVTPEIRRELRGSCNRGEKDMNLQTYILAVQLVTFFSLHTYTMVAEQKKCFNDCNWNFDSSLVISLTCFLTVTYLRHYQAYRGRQVGRTTSANGGRLAIFSSVNFYT
jgi:hypothetical protein